MLLRLAHAQLGGRLGRDHVVDARGAAAQRRPPAGRRSSSSGIVRSTCARLGAHLLRVPEVAGVVVGDAGPAPGARGACGSPSASTSCTSRTRALNAAARSAHAGSSSSRWPYSFIDEPQPATLVTTWSTSRSRTAAIVAPGPGQRGLLAPGVQLQRAAALLVAGHEHVAALGGEHPHGGLVDPVEEHVLHAARQQRHPAAAGPDRGGVHGQPGERLAHRDRRQQRLHRRQPARAAARPAPRSPAPGAAPGRAPRAGRPRAAAACTGTARRSRRGTAGRPGRASRCARPAGAPTPAAGRTAPRTGTPSRRPCSPGSASMCSWNGPSRPISPFSARFIR